MIIKVLSTKVISYSMLISLVLVLALGLYWLYSPPREVLTIHTLPVPVTHQPVKPGDYVILTYDYCKNARVSGTVTYELISDRTKLSVPDAWDTTPKTCISSLSVPVPVPPQTPPGKYHIHYETSYKFNPLVTRTQEWDSEKFEVK